MMIKKTDLPVQDLEYTEIYRMIHRKVIREAKTRKQLRGLSPRANYTEKTTDILKLVIKKIAVWQMINKFENQQNVNKLGN